MTDPVVQLDAARLAVEPGGTAQLTVTVTNRGGQVTGYTFEVLGDAAAWSETPAKVSVMPGASGTAVIRFSPPAGAAVAGGVVPFGVRVQSEQDPDASAVAEGDLDVKQIVELTAAIRPESSSGRWRGYHNVQLTNYGNSSTRLRIEATDPDDALGFLIKPPIVDLPLGASARVRITVRARKPFLRGNPVQHPIKVVGERDDARPQAGPVRPESEPGRPTVQGYFTQKPILSKAVVIIGTAVVAAAVAAGVYAATRQTAAQALPNAVPPTPELVAVAVGPDSIRLSWKKIDLIQSYNLFSIDPRTRRTFGTTKVDPGLDQFMSTALKPRTEYCYQLQSIRPNLQSGRSNVACATTTPAPATASPSAGVSSASASSPATQSSGQSSPTGTRSSASSTSTPTPTSTPASTPTGTPTGTPPASTASPGNGVSAAVPNGKWIAVAWVSDSQSEIDRAIAALNTSGINGSWLDGPQYPNMTLQGGQPYQGFGPLAYVGWYDTADQAGQECAKVDNALSRAGMTQQQCIAVQPGQPG